MWVTQMIAMQYEKAVAPTAPVPSRCLKCEARAQSVCDAVDDCDLSRLAAAATVIDVAAGSTFIEEGAPAIHFFNVTAGVARLFKLLPDGRRQITGFARKGDFLGLAAGSRYAFSAEAMESVRVCRFARQTLTGFLAEFPALEHRLLQDASSGLAAAQDQMLLLGRKTARERVASFLRSEFMRIPACDRTRTIVLPMTRSDIADYLGLTIETVSRTMTCLRKAGIIGVPNASSVEIRDVTGLEEIAEGTTPNRSMGDLVRRDAGPTNVAG